MVFLPRFNGNASSVTGAAWFVPTATSVSLMEHSNVSSAARVSQALDGSALFEEPYMLEVSSPGLDRPLVTRQDFQRVLGRRVTEVTKKLRG